MDLINYININYNKKILNVNYKDIDKIFVYILNNIYFNNIIINDNILLNYKKIVEYKIYK